MESREGLRSHIPQSAKAQHPTLPQALGDGEATRSHTQSRFFAAPPPSSPSFIRQLDNHL